jgi:hypothetical protein
MKIVSHDFRESFQATWVALVEINEPR